jgi:hypothetical protein
MAETSASARLLIFSGATDLCETQEKMEAMTGHSVWMDDFIPVNSPQKCLIESLLWFLYSDGVCFAISGFFPAYLAGRFKELEFAGLYIAICGTPKSETLRFLLEHDSNDSDYFTLELKFAAISPDLPGGFGVVDIDEKYSVNILITPIGSRRSCGPRSNLNFVKHVGHICSSFINTPPSSS